MNFHEASSSLPFSPLLSSLLSPVSPPSCLSSLLSPSTLLPSFPPSLFLTLSCLPPPILQVALAQQRADKNKVQGEPRGGGAPGGGSDSDPLDSTDCTSESSGSGGGGGRSQDLAFLPDLPCFSSSSSSSSSSSAPQPLQKAPVPEKRQCTSLHGFRDDKPLVNISKPHQK